MALLTREQILATPGRRFEEVEVPEWGGSVRVWSLRADELLEAQSLIRAKSPLVVAWTVSRTVGDEGGPAPEPWSLEDVEALREKHPAALLKLFNVAFRISKASAAAAEEIRGN